MRNHDGQLTGATYAALHRGELDACGEFDRLVGRPSTIYGRSGSCSVTPKLKRGTNMPGLLWSAPGRI